MVEKQPVYDFRTGFLFSHFYNKNDEILRDGIMLPHLIESVSRLPTSEQLPCSDDTPVDNENQNTIPNWLIAILEQIENLRLIEQLRQLGVDI